MSKQRRKSADVPIIFLTAHLDEDHNIVEGYESGAVDYLQKPVNPAILRSKIAVFARLHRKAREAQDAGGKLLAEVAQRRQAEVVLSELNSSLELRVTERTAALAQANRRKDEFLATLAHELRNPLAPVRNAVDLLKLKADLSADVRRAVDIIDRQVTRMARLIDDLMDIGRVNTGRIQLRSEPVEIGAVIAEAIETVQPHIEEKGLVLTVSPSPAPFVVDGDPARLAQVFANLLGNAAKFTGQGGVVGVRAAIEDHSIVTSITDDGIGIAPERLEQVFEMFSQEVPANLRSTNGGMGIGLALTRRLVEMHGGTVTGHSEGIGTGSRFVVRLPAGKGGRTVALKESPTAFEPAPCAIRILVVDDNRDAADTLKMLLDMLGHHVSVVYDGEAGVVAATSFDAELVFLDIGMPKMNGYEVCRAMRSAQPGTSRTIVAVTGWGQVRDLERSSEAGFDDHLVKPVVAEELMKIISRRQQLSVRRL